MKKKLIIGITILVIGIVLAIVGILINKPNDKITLKPKEENNETENIYKDKEIIVFDFSEEETEQDITVSFTVYNNSNRTIENTALFLDYYDNSKKTYTAEFAIDSLKPGEKMKKLFSCMIS